MWYVHILVTPLESEMIPKQSNDETCVGTHNGGLQRENVKIAYGISMAWWDYTHNEGLIKGAVGIAYNMPVAWWDGVLEPENFF